MVSEDSLLLESFLLIACTEPIVTISGTVGYSGFPAFGQVFVLHLLRQKKFGQRGSTTNGHTLTMAAFLP